MEVIFVLLYLNFWRWPLFCFVRSESLTVGGPFSTFLSCRSFSTLRFAAWKSRENKKRIKGTEVGAAIGPVQNVERPENPDTERKFSFFRGVFLCFTLLKSCLQSTDPAQGAKVSGKIIGSGDLLCAEPVEIHRFFQREKWTSC